MLCLGCCVVRVLSVVRVEALRLLALGCSARDVARRLPISSRTVRVWASLAGMRFAGRFGGRGGIIGPWPPDPWVVGRRLTVAARVLIRVRLDEDWWPARIAAELGVHRSTVTREIVAGTRAGRYDPGFAEQRAERARSRPKLRKLEPGTPLRQEVVNGLNRRYSPQQIAGRLALDFPDRHDMRVSHETIYQALYLQGKGSLREELKAVKALRSGRVKRRTRSRLPPRAGKPWLQGAHISQRPAEVADRAVPGHWEGDLVIGGGDNHRSALISLIERSTRFTLIARLADNHHSATVVDRITATMRELPIQLQRTLTWDQGSEMAEHHSIKLAEGFKVYFCDPHSPWQRGSNENLNGLIRDFYPKSTDFAHITDEEIANMQHLLNTRPRKTLQYRTPAEKLNELLTVAPTT